MISKEIIEKNPALTLVTSDQFKRKYTKRNFIYENGKFLLGAARNSKVIENIKKEQEVQILLGNLKLNCRAEIRDNYEKVFDFLKKEMARLKKFYGNKYDRSEAHLKVSASNQVLIILRCNRTDK